jgi:hypothetical protein
VFGGRKSARRIAIFYLSGALAFAGNPNHRDRHLFGAEAAGYVTVDPSKVGGLQLRLVDR